MESFINFVIGISQYSDGGLDSELFGLDFGLFWAWRPSFLVDFTCLLTLFHSYYLTFAPIAHVNPLPAITDHLSLLYSNVVHLFRPSSIRKSRFAIGCRSVAPLHLSHRMSF